MKKWEDDESPSSIIRDYHIFLTCGNLVQGEHKFEDAKALTDSVHWFKATKNNLIQLINLKASELVEVPDERKLPDLNDFLDEDKT